MKKLLYLLFAITLLGCGSNSSEEIINIDYPIDIDVPKIPKYYNLLFRKNYRPKYETGFHISFGNTGEYGFRNHKSVDTLLVDLKAAVKHVLRLSLCNTP